MSDERHRLIKASSFTYFDNYSEYVSLLDHQNDRVIVIIHVFISKFRDLIQFCVKTLHSRDNLNS